MRDYGQIEKREYYQTDDIKWISSKKMERVKEHRNREKDTAG